MIPGSACGAQRYSLESEEDELEVLLGCAQIGYSKTHH